MQQKYFPFLIMALLFSLSLSAQYSGKASYYSAKLDGNRTASGEIYRHQDKTCASRDFPFGSILRVSARDGRSTVVRVIDCGPSKADRVIDVSGAAAEELGMIQQGVIDVKIEVIQLGSGSLPCPSNYPIKPKSIFVPRASRAPASYGTVVNTTTVKEEKPTKAASTSSSNMPQSGTFPISILDPINGGYAVQVASFNSLKNVRQHAKELKQKGFRDILVSFGNKKYKVLLGPFANKSMASEYQKNLKKKYKINGFVTLINK